MDSKHYFEANNRLWDKKTQFHYHSDFYDVKSFLEGQNSLSKIEIQGLGNNSGQKNFALTVSFRAG